MTGSRVSARVLPVCLGSFTSRGALPAKKGPLESKLKTIMGTPPKTKQSHGQPLTLALACFALGIADTWLLLSLGVEFSVSGRDATLVIGAFFAVSFAIFGWLLGLTIAAKKRERHLARERRETLLRLAEAQSRVAQQEKMAALGQLVASVAHEVRNPLAIIRSGVQNLSEEAQAGSQPKPEDFESIIVEIDRLARVVEALSHVARPLQPRHIPTTTGEIADRVRFMVENLYKDRGTPVLRIDAPSDHKPIQGDPDLICQALLALVVNAVEVSPVDQPVDLVMASGEDRVTFEVSDQGPGIPEKLRDRVFEPFFTTKPEGNGLGLAIAQQIAGALGGALNLDDRAGGGARLTLNLPRFPQQNPILSEKQPHTAGEGP